MEEEEGEMKNRQNRERQEGCGTLKRNVVRGKKSFCSLLSLVSIKSRTLHQNKPYTFIIALPNFLVATS